MKDIVTILLLLGLIALGILLLWFFIFKVKHLKTPDVYCVDGGVKTGKSLVCVYLAVRQIRKNRRKAYIFNFFRKYIGNVHRKIHKKTMKPLKEIPMLYSNMPLRCVKYNEFKLDILLRKVRIPYGSVCLIDEASLLADSMLGMKSAQDKKDRFDYVNERLTLFLKLYGHYSHGGSCFYNTQAIVDLHFAFKRCTSTYLFIAKNRKFPFFCLLDVREMIHSEDGDAVNTITTDIDNDDKPLFILKKYYKYYDRYYLSRLTDELPLLVNYDVIKLDKKAEIKINKIITLGKYKEIEDFNKKQKGIFKFYRSKKK